MIAEKTTLRRLRKWVEAKRIVEGMKPWFAKINERGKSKKESSIDGRTVNEQCFDSGVFAASEMIRRLTGDEELALAIHEVCIWRQREHASDESTKSNAE
jgi:hypothetical protein